MKIFSPMARGNGAYVIHKILAQKIPDYSICSYNPYWSLISPTLLFLCNSKSSADIIHTTPDYACWFTKKGTPLVITFHNYVIDPFMASYSSLLQRIHYKTNLLYFTKLALKKAAAVTSVSKFTAQLLRRDLGYNGKIKVIYNGVDTNLFRPAAQKPQRKKIKVLFSGNLTRRKGADLICLIAQKLEPGIEILYTTGLRTKKTLPDTPNIKNIGSIPYSKMPLIYQDADILLFPTVREGFALAAVEAMACGLPVIATNCSSLPELIIDGKGGFLCKLGDVDEFAECINKLADSSGLRSEMGTFNRARVEQKFTVQQMVQEYMNLFKSTLNSRR